MNVMSLWNPGDHVVLWATSVLLQVTVVALFAFSLAALLKRNPSVRHWVLCGSLFLVLVSPALALTLQLAGGFAWTVPPAPPVAVLDAETSPLPAPAKPSPDVSVPTVSSLPASPPPAPAPAEVVSVEPVASVPIVASPMPADPIVKPVRAWRPPSIASVLRTVMPPLMLVWCFGSVFLLMRLLASYWRLAGLLGSASSNNNHELAHLFRRVGRALGVSEMPALLVSRELTGPVSAGWRQPCVILPEQMVERASTAQLHDVLVHEVAHIVRRDQLVVFFQNLAAALFWIHPLTTSLNRRLAQAREEVCDNYVLEVTDAPAYGRTLLGLAQLIQQQPQPAGVVGLFTASWRLERRVAGLLDERRSRRVYLTHRGRSLVAVAIIAMVAVAALGTVAPSASDSQEQDAGSSPAGVADTAEEVNIRGLVVDEDGRPIDGADVHLLQGSFLRPGGVRERVLTRTSRSGGFAATYTPDAFLGATTGHLLVTAEGYGVNWMPLAEVVKSPELVLALPRDRKPIEGQILDLEGNPVVGAEVTVAQVRLLDGENLDRFVAVAKAGQGDNFRFDRYLFEPQHFEPQLTDSEGRFRLSGIGPERLVELRVKSDAIQHVRLRVMTRDSEPIAPAREVATALRRPPVFGASFSYLVPPSRPIGGRVVDSETRQPLAGINVGSLGSASSSTTDAEGRFELLGCAKADSYRLLAHPTGDQPYLAASMRVPDEPGLEKLEIEFEMFRGVLVTGRVTDESTGGPVGAEATYFPVFPNDHVVRGVGGMQADAVGAFSTGHSQRDGSFKVVVLPGPGFIGIRASQRGRFQSASVDPAAFYQKQGVAYGGGLGASSRSIVTALGSGAMSAMPQSNFEAIELLNVDPSTEKIELEMKVSPSPPIVGRVLDETNEAVADVHAYGLSGIGFGRHQRLADGSFSVAGMNRSETRSVVFLQFDRKLVGFSEVTSGIDQPVEVRMKAWGEVKGRLLDADGQPLANSLLYSRPRNGEAAGHLPRRQTTDEQGRFHIVGLIPGQVYRLQPSGQVGPEIRVVAQPGQVLDVGELRAKQGGEPVPGTRAASESGSKERLVSARATSPQRAPLAGSAPRPSTSTGQTERETTTISGDILGVDGRPANAALAVVAYPSPVDFLAGGQLLASGASDPDGQFSLEISGVSSETHQYPYLVARAPGSGLVWRKVDLDQPRSEIHLRLKEQQPIRVRLVDIEGRPAANLAVRLKSIVESGRIRDRYMSLFPLEPRPEAWIPVDLRTDSEGWLTLDNVDADGGVIVEVLGTSQFATQDLALNTGLPEERGERDATYRSLVKNLAPGQVATIPLAPAQIFQGVVLLGETSKPAANARIKIWASQQEVGGSMYSIEGRTDDQGRFRLNPRPGVRFGIVAHPPKGAPYQVRRLNDLRWSSAQESKDIEIRLEEGVLARGKVVDGATGKPLRNASVQYHPSRLNENLTSDMVTGWQSIQRTDDNGQFAISVLPGQGTLLVHADAGGYILEELGSRQLNSGKPGGTRTYAHAFEPINPSVGESTEELVIELTPGVSVTGTIVDEQNRPIEEALVISKLKIAPTSPQWRGFPDEAKDGRFVLKGLRPGTEYPVYFLDAKRKLGATVTISSTTPNPRVVLRPCGAATLRFVNPAGEPLPAGLSLGLHMVVTPGALKFDREASQRGELAADEDFISNIDRVNYGSGGLTDEQAEVRYPVLIPGARYRFFNYVNGRPITSADFVAQSGVTHEIGEIEVNLND